MRQPVAEQPPGIEQPLRGTVSRTAGSRRSDAPRRATGGQRMFYRTARLVAALTRAFKVLTPFPGNRGRLFQPGFVKGFYEGGAAAIKRRGSVSFRYAFHGLGQG